MKEQFWDCGGCCHGAAASTEKLQYHRQWSNTVHRHIRVALAGSRVTSTTAREASRHPGHHKGPLLPCVLCVGLQMGDVRCVLARRGSCDLSMMGIAALLATS